MSDSVIYPANDVGNGARLADSYSDRARWVLDIRCWIVWDGKRWQRQPDGVLVEGLAKLAALSIAIEAAAIEHDGTRQEHLRHAARSMDMSRIRAACDSAKSVPRMQARSDDLDADPFLVNVANGTFDIRTGSVRPHDPADLITKVAPHRYEVSASAPLWMGLKRRATQVDPSGETAKFLQLVQGYMLLGGNPEHRIIFLIGPAKTGKSQLIEIPQRVLGADYAGTANASLITRGKYDINTEEKTALEKFRFIAISETDGSMRLDETAVKTYTGSQTMAQRNLYQAQRQAPIVATIIVATNEAPQIEKFDDAIQRRILMIPSGPPLTEDERDSAIAARILRDEGDGVLTSLLMGAHQWFVLAHQGRQDGERMAAVFEQYLPAAVAVETHTFAQENDPVVQFVDDWLEFGQGREFRVASAAVMRAYEEARGTRHHLGRRRLFERIAQVAADRGHDLSRDTRTFRGARLRPFGPYVTEDEPA